VSLQYSVAEALYRGKCDVHSYDAESLRDLAILDLAKRVSYTVDKSAPGRSQFKGWVIVETRDGRRLERIEEHNWGSREKPMTPSDIEAKFRVNAGVVLETGRVGQIVSAVRGIEAGGSIRDLVTLCIQ
jgi:2-methylcitrate dehydratase PrpD